MRLAACLLALALSSATVSVASSAVGQGAPQSGPAAAKKHFAVAKKAYKAGAYREAISELNQAIALDPKGKDLFFNLGLVHEKLGEIDEAITAFKRYSELETDTDELEKAIQTVRRLEGARDELARKKEEAAVPPEEPEVVAAPAPEKDAPPSRDSSKKGRLDGWVYATGGLALVAFGVGTYYGLQALSTRQSTEDATGDRLRVQDLEARAKDAHEYAVVADVAFAVGAASAGAAALLYFTRDAVPSSPRVAARVAPRAALFSIEGAF